jgi:hypothetical protein
VKALLLAFLVAMPPGVHYQGTVGTGAVQWVPPVTNPVLDGGSSFPLSTVFAQGTRATITRTGVTTNGAGLIVIALAGNSTSTNKFPYSGVTVGASAATAIKQMTWLSGQSFPGAGTAEIWAYWSSGALNNVTVTASHTSEVSSEVITVWAYTAATVKDGSSTIGNCFGALGGKQQDASTTVDASLTSVASSSVIVGAFLDGQASGGLTALGNTNWRATNDDAVNASSERTVDAASQSGNVTVGSSTSTTLVATAAAEILVH